MTILKKVWNIDPMLLAVREDYWIRKMSTKYWGINIVCCFFYSANQELANIQVIKSLT